MIQPCKVVVLRAPGILEQGSANFFAGRTGLSQKKLHGLSLKVNINIRQLSFILAHITIVIQ